MSDRRLTPANSFVIAAGCDAPRGDRRVVSGEAARVGVPLAPLLRAPGGARDRELLRGALVTVYDRRDGWAFVQCAADDYVGYLRDSVLDTADPAPTHRVATRATHAYSAPDMKSEDRALLSLGAQLRVDTIDTDFATTDAGYVPSTHLAALDAPAPDPVAVAETLLGTPYLWGGNSTLGIDCSGLVQIACAACGMACPADSDLQEAAFADTRPNDAPRRGDLLFWKGHVAWVADPDTILHANAFHMAVAFEPLQSAITRIADQGDGPVTLHARP